MTAKPDTMTDDQQQQMWQPISDFLQEHFDLSDVEAQMILDDIVLNLEGMLADWKTDGSDASPPEWRRDRIASALEALGRNLRCDRLQEIGADLNRALRSDEPSGAELLSPLQAFVTELRAHMPDIHRPVVD